MLKPSAYLVPVSGGNFDVTADGQRFLVLKAATDPGASETSAARINVVQNWFEDVKRRVPSR